MPDRPPFDPDAIDLKANPAFNVLAKIAYAVFFIGICASAASMVILLVRGDEHPWKEIASITLVTILIFGPMIGAIVWATRRHSRRDGRSMSDNA